MSEPLPNEECAKADVDSGLYEAHYIPQIGDTVLDLGAHVGYYTERALGFVGDTGTVIAFEPDPINYQRLVERVGGRKNVFTVNAGAGQAFDRLPFYHCPVNSGAHRFFKGSDVVLSHNAIIIDVGLWLKLLKFEPAFAKIDTEGFETMILTSLFDRGFKPQIAFECHSAEDYFEIKKLAQSNGYRLLPESPSIGICYLIR